MVVYRELSEGLVIGSSESDTSRKAYLFTNFSTIFYILDILPSCTTSVLNPGEVLSYKTSPNTTGNNGNTHYTLSILLLTRLKSDHC